MDAGGVKLVMGFHTFRCTMAGLSVCGSEPLMFAIWENSASRALQGMLQMGSTSAPDDLHEHQCCYTSMMSQR